MQLADTAAFAGVAGLPRPAGDPPRPGGAAHRRRHRRQRPPRSARCSTSSTRTAAASPASRCTRASLDDVFLSLTGQALPPQRSPPVSDSPCPRPIARGVAPRHADACTLITRALRLSLRNVDGLITALALPVLLMLMFVYLFGGAIARRRRIRRLRRARRAAGLRRLRRRDDGGQRRPRSDRRHHRPVPLDGRPRRGADQQPRRRERGPQTCCRHCWFSRVAFAIGFRPHAERRPAGSWQQGYSPSSCWRCPGSPRRRASSPARPRRRTASRSWSASCPTRAARSSRSTPCPAGFRDSPATSR